MEKERDVTICPSSPGINVRYRSIPESIGSHYLSSVTYLNCYGCDCLQSPGWLGVSPRSFFIEPEKRRRLVSPNKDTSLPNKSMLTVCLHRLGDSPALWFLIRHMMRRRAIGICEGDCCMRPGWFDCVCISSASIDGNDFDSRFALSPLQQTLSGGKYMHFTFLFRRNCLIKMCGEIIFSLLIEPDVDKTSAMKTDGENNQMLHICLDESEFFRLYSAIIHTILTNSLIFIFLV